MRVILTETIEALGLIGTEINVKDGYARNYLMPQKKAVPATPENRKRMEREKTRVELQIAKEKQTAEEIAARIQGVVCRIPAKIGDEDRLYGSITVRDIVDSLSGQGISVDKKMVLLSEPIKTAGTHMVPIRVYKGIKPEITVEVVPE